MLGKVIKTKVADDITVDNLQVFYKKISACSDKKCENCQ